MIRFYNGIRRYGEKGAVFIGSTDQRWGKLSMFVKRVAAEARKIVKRDGVMVVALLLALVTSCFHVPRLEYIDFNVLAILLSLMLVITGFKQNKLLDCLALGVLRRTNSVRSLYIFIIGLTFLASMLITNDVALLTFVPLTLVIGRKLKLDMAQLVIWQTLAANLGSAFTPMGNPQNLFIYAHYAFSVGEFFRTMLPLTVFSLLILLVLALTVSSKEIKLELEQLPWRITRESAIFTLLLGLNILAVFRCVSYLVALGITIVAVFCVSRRLFRYVDYTLLLTFVGFFIFIGNISSFSCVSLLKEAMLSAPWGVYVSGILVSQLVSNVPATMLLAGFTDSGRELLLGVNVGGLGTLIASMASVISYKLYAENNLGQNGTYLRQFLFYNFLLLAILAPLVWVTRG